MERLTERNERGNANLIGVDTARLAGLGANTLFKILAALSRLAAYEDTGLEPEQIKEAVDLLEDTISMSKVERPKALMDWIERCTWHVRKCDELHGKLEQYERAESEGRLIILPVVPGNELTRDGKVYRADSWTVLLLAFSEHDAIVLDVKEAAAAIEAQKGADDARNHIPWEAD